MLFFNCFDAPATVKKENQSAPADLQVARALVAAQGYSELGMMDEALGELDELSAAARRRVDVLGLRVQLLVQSHRWRPALDACRALCALEPDSPQPFIHAAYCLHELGRTSEAKALLLAGPAALRQEATFYYNLGCYDATLGDIEGAQNYLRTSFRMDKKFRDFARTDPDLEAVRDLL